MPQEIFDRAECFGGFVLQHEDGGHAQDKSLVCRVDFRGAPIGFLGLRIVFGQLVMDSQGI